jgi:hypothetical protein
VENAVDAGPQAAGCLRTSSRRDAFLVFRLRTARTAPGADNNDDATVIAHFLSAMSSADGYVTSTTSVAMGDAPLLLEPSFFSTSLSLSALETWSSAAASVVVIIGCRRRRRRHRRRRRPRSHSRPLPRPRPRRGLAASAQSSSSPLSLSWSRRLWLPSGMSRDTYKTCFIVAATVADVDIVVLGASSSWTRSRSRSCGPCGRPRRRPDRRRCRRRSRLRPRSSPPS